MPPPKRCHIISATCSPSSSPGSATSPAEPPMLIMTSLPEDWQALIDSTRDEPSLSSVAPKAI